MSDRDELARVLDPSGVEGRHIGTAHAGLVLHERQAAAIAEVLWSAGWRKKPSRGDLIVQLAQFWAGQHSLETATDAILALLDGPTETGEK